MVVEDTALRDDALARLADDLSHRLGAQEVGIWLGVGPTAATLLAVSGGVAADLAHAYEVVNDPAVPVMAPLIDGRPAWAVSLDDLRERWPVMHELPVGESVAYAFVPWVNASARGVVVAGFADGDAVSDTRRADILATVDEISREFAPLIGSHASLAAATSVYDVLFAEAPIGFGLFDRQLRFLRVNDALARLNRVPAADHSGHDIRTLLPDAVDVVRHLETVVRTGLPVTAEVSGAREGETQREYYRCAYHPLLAADGGVIAVGATVMDVTAERTAQAERDALHASERAAHEAADRAAGENANLRDLASRLAAAATAAGAAAAIVRAITGVLPAIEAGVYLEDADDPLLLRRVAHRGASSDHDRPEDFDSIPVDAAMPVCVAYREGRAQLFAELSDWEGYPAELVAAVQASGTPVVGVLPLASGERSTGAIYANFPADEPPSSATWLFLIAVGLMSGPVLDRLRLVDAERRAQAEVAALHARLQSALLPPAGAARGSRVLTAYRAGDRRLILGGDFIDHVTAADGSIAAIIGDVAGHGPAAAGLGAQLRTAWRALHYAGTAAQDVLPILNEMVEAQGEEAGLFATVLCVWIDAGAGRMRHAVAGHPAPLRIASDGTSTAVDVTPGPPLGIRLRTGWTVGEVELEDTVQLLLFTDGAIEGRAAPQSDDRLGVEGLRALVAEQAGVADRASLTGLVDRVERLNGSALADDIALIAVDVRR